MSGRPATAILMSTVNMGGSAVSVMAGLSTGSQSGPGVTFTESVYREYVDGALKAVQEAFRHELRQDIRLELEGGIMEELTEKSSGMS